MRKREVEIKRQRDRYLQSDGQQTMSDRQTMSYRHTEGQRGIQTHRKTDKDSGREGKTSKINKHVQEEMSVVSKGSLLFIIDVFLLVRMHHQN